jgi:predicted oxidoreductase
VPAGAVDGVSGVVLAPDGSARGQSSNRDSVGSFELRAGAVIVTRQERARAAALARPLS